MVPKLVAQLGPQLGYPTFSDKPVPLASNFGNSEDVTFSNTNSNVQQNDFQSPERENFSFNGSTPTHNFRTPENGNFQSPAQSPSFSPSPSYPPPNAAYGNSTLDQQYQQ